MSVRFRPDRQKWEWSGKIKGKRKRLLFDTKTEASSHGSLNGMPSQNREVGPNDITITKSVQSYYRSRSDPKSRTTKANERKYFNLLEHFLVADCGLSLVSEVRYTHLVEFQRWLQLPRVYLGKQMHWAPATVNRAFNSIKDYFVHQVRDGVITASPCQHLAQLECEDNSRRPMTDLEFKLAYPAAEEWFKPAMLFIHLTASAPSSVERLKWSDVNFDQRLVTITRRKGSRGRWRRIAQPMSNELEALLLALARTQSRLKPHASVFRNEHGGPLSAEWCSRIGNRAIKAAGLDGVVLYCMRHALASDLCDANVNLEVVRQLMGHANIRTTQNYTKPKVETLATALELVRGESVTPECHQTKADVAAGGM